jgi:hypothetical protein
MKILGLICFMTFLFTAQTQGAGTLRIKGRVPATYQFDLLIDGQVDVITNAPPSRTPFNVMFVEEQKSGVRLITIIHP